MSFVIAKLSLHFISILFGRFDFASSKRKNSEDISFGASTSKKMSTTSKKKNAETGKRTKSICKDLRTRKTRAPLHRRQALNSIN